MNKKIFGAYLEDYNYIKIIIENDIIPNEMILKDRFNNEEQELKIFLLEEYANELHIYTNMMGKIILHHDYECIVNGKIIIPLSLGKITRTKQFEDENNFNGWLGCKYNKNATTFRVWSPVTKEIYVMVNEKPYKMDFLEKGVWEKTVESNCDGLSYYYYYRINEEFCRTIDPYGISINVDKTVNYVINPKRVYKDTDDFLKMGNDFNYQKAIVYETNIRDFTINLPVSHPGTFLGMVESNDLGKEGLNYIKNLGITHLQLMPIWCFGGVNEDIKDNKNPYFRYNWGYNPEAYFVPSGWYTTNPNDPYKRINELKLLINTLHQKGLGVNIDVVFNHVYKANNFSMAMLVPGYMYLTDERGFLTDSSGCGNDVATEKQMVKKLVIDNINFWQDFYHIDGFRFDLMGLMDLELIKSISEMLKKKNSYAMIYGEGWNMDVRRPVERRANMNNANKLLEVAFFNDSFRNFFKNREFTNFAKGEKFTNNALKELILGSTNSLFTKPEQSINYVECHDNETLYDYLNGILDHNEKQIKDITKVILGLVILAKGIPFLHSGSELLRTKLDWDNSYNLGDEVNHFPWEKMDCNQDLYETIHDLIKLRQLYSCFTEDSSTCKPHVRTRGQTFSFCYHYHQVDEIEIIIKNNNIPETIYFAPNVLMVYDGKHLVNEPVSYLQLDHPGLYVLKK